MVVIPWARKRSKAASRTVSWARDSLTPVMPLLVRVAAIGIRTHAIRVGAETGVESRSIVAGPPQPRGRQDPAPRVSLGRGAHVQARDRRALGGGRALDGRRA